MPQLQFRLLVSAALICRIRVDSQPSAVSATLWRLCTIRLRSFECCAVGPKEIGCLPIGILGRPSERQHYGTIRTVRRTPQISPRNGRNIRAGGRAKGATRLGNLRHAGGRPRPDFQIRTVPALRVAEKRIGTASIMLCCNEVRTQAARRQRRPPVAGVGQGYVHTPTLRLERPQDGLAHGP